MTFASACRHPSGAFAPHPAQGEELLSTVSAVQLALLLKEPQLVDETKVSAYAAWRPGGSSQGATCGDAVLKHGPVDAATASQPMFVVLYIVLSFVDTLSSLNCQEFH